MKFTVSKYMKGTQERGFVIGAVDEILQILDDNAMNLQSMSASRFVGPFLETVNKWEKSLSHIGEVVEVKSLILNQPGLNCFLFWMWSRKSIVAEMEYLFIQDLVYAAKHEQLFQG